MGVSIPGGCRDVVDGGAISGRSMSSACTPSNTNVKGASE